MPYGLDTIIFGVGVLVLVIVGAALLGVGGSGRAGGPKKVYNLLGGIAIGSGLLAAMVTAVVYFSTSSSQGTTSNAGEVMVFDPPLTWKGLIKSNAERNAILDAQNAMYGPSTHQKTSRKTSRKDSRKTSRKTSRKEPAFIALFESNRFVSNNSWRLRRRWSPLI